MALVDQVLPERDGYSEHDKVREYRADIVDEAGLDRTFQRIEDELGPVSILVNCAGIGAPQPVVKHGKPILLKDCQRIIEINLLGTINAIRCSVPQMINRRSSPSSDEQAAVIINVSSIAAFEGQINQAIYSASKGGVIGLTLPLARELGEYGIRVMGIAPGIFATPMTMDLPEKARESVFAMVPPFPRRAGEPKHFADLVLSIIGNPMLNGEVIRLDGGLRLPATV